jgi:membrane protein DedA with SNARE-associated domain
VPRPALIVRFAPAGLATAAVALAIAIAVGIVSVPDLAGRASDGTEALGAWVYLAVLTLIFLETSTLVGFVIHGELVLLVAGVAAERGDVSLPLVVALATAAAVLGDTVSFLIGRRLGRQFLARHGARLRLGPEQLARVDGFFDRHGGKALLLGRFTGFLRATMPFVAGSSDMPLQRLVRIGVVSALAWTVLFTVLGYAFSDSFARTGDTASRIALVAVLLATVAFALHSHRTRRH